MLFYLYIRRDYNGNKLDQCLKILEFTLVTKNLIYKKIEGNSRKKQFLQEIDISVVLDDVVIGTLNPDFIKATYTVWKHLLRDPLIFDLVEMDSRLRQPADKLIFHHRKRR